MGPNSSEILAGSLILAGLMLTILAVFADAVWR
jgi:hypothetical protein